MIAPRLGTSPTLQKLPSPYVPPPLPPSYFLWPPLQPNVGTPEASVWGILFSFHAGPFLLKFPCVNVACSWPPVFLSPALASLISSGSELPASRHVFLCIYLQLNAGTSVYHSPPTVLHHDRVPTYLLPMNSCPSFRTHLKCLLLASLLLCAPKRALCLRLTWPVSPWRCHHWCGFCEVKDHALLVFKFSSRSRVRGTW